MVKSGSGVFSFTFKVISVEWVLPPPSPVTVSVYWLTGAEVVVDIVNILSPVGVTGLMLKTSEASAGKPAILRLTAESNPFNAVRVTV